ncbi:fluoride efflux transporter CrcB [Streptomyces mangrovisoli]|uniref:Fluoride-specific ion channel FluC n=1 Tax=Streptomyces mangrovisoli TaxID=1428628 RepID=A0A1J4NN98_9ACTN|nr:fluoride efflux transporter CrcB [Streptomyces mangrovisoli]OIJ62646.1 chromosome condensation protein CrcB [Streptomyces mangrovisoli]
MTAPEAESLRVPARSPRQPVWRGQAPVVGVVALGGALGATARYAAGLQWPTPAVGFPWTTLCVNVVGCALMGVLMVVITEVRSAHRLVRPFLGTGVLGGFTTFSTYVVDIRRLIDSGRPLVGLAYLAATLVAALAAVWLAALATRRAMTRRQR